MINLSQNGLTHNEIIDNLMSKWLPYIQYRVDLIRDNSKIKTLEYQQCSVKCLNKAEIKYSASLTIKETEIDKNKDQIRLIMYVEDNQKIFEFPFVPLNIISSKIIIKKGIRLLNIECLDNNYFLQQSCLGEVPYFSKGTSYTSTISNLIRKVGFTYTNIQPTNKSFIYDREEWKANDKVLSVVNNLAKEINYEDITIDINGVPFSKPYKSLDINNFHINYKADNKSIIFEDKSVEFDNWNKPNIFLASVFPEELEKPINVEYKNTNPADPTSILNSKYKIIHVFDNIKNIADYESLYAETIRLANEISSNYEKAELKTSIMPHHETNELISVSCDGITGFWQEISWSIDNFSPGGKMTHELRRIYY